ncbi:MAG: RNA polymerase sigma factor [Planctomycetota bacterium JB042]
MLGERHEEWVRAAREGDDEAFGELVRSSWPALVRSVEAAVGDHHEAQDLVQEALLRAHGRLDRLEADAHFVPWVRRIARNVAVDRMRRRRRQLAVELLDPDSLRAAEVREADPARNADEEEDRERRLVRLWHDIAELPPRERRLLLLYYGRGMSIGAVAEECGMSTSGVKVALHRARRSLVERTVGGATRALRA